MIRSNVFYLDKRDVCQFENSLGQIRERLS